MDLRVLFVPAQVAVDAVQHVHVAIGLELLANEEAGAFGAA